MNSPNIEQTRDHLLQASDVERELNVHRVTLLRWAKRGIAPQPLKIGGRWFWRNSEVQQLIAGEWQTALQGKKDVVQDGDAS
jgi:predicted DNA-binding transcriptional regulator AlpA